MRCRSITRGLRRIPAWLALGGCGSALLATGHVMEAVAADPPAAAVVVVGTGDSDILAELRSWQNAVFKSPQRVDFSYFELGTTVARRELLEGKKAFAIVGVPFTEDELAARPAGSGELIDLPIAVTSLSVIVTEPTFGVRPGWITAESDPNCEDPEGCEFIYAPYDGPIRIPPDNLSAIVMNLPASFQGNNLDQWSHPEMQAATADGTLIIQQRSNQRHSALSRTEGTAANRYIMDYFAELAPTSWALSKENYATFPYEPIREEFSTRQKTRSRLDAQLRDIMRTESAGEGGRPSDWTGNLGVIPTTYVPRLANEFPLINYRVVEIQNANGDWVSPTPETVSAAVAAGDGTNIALYEKVPGAYPLVYANRMYTVAGTLTPEKANALAAIVRYVATDGQAVVVADQGTPMTAPMVAEALAGADEIVAKNCTAAGFEVIVSGPSEFEADTPGVQAIASMNHCRPIPVPATTTTTTTTTTVSETTTTVLETTTTVPSSTTTTSTVSPSVPTAVTPATSRPVPTQQARPPATNPAPVAPAATTPTTLAEVATTVAETAPATTAESTIPESTTTTSTVAPRKRGVALTDLPLSRPSDGSNGPKQLGTIMLGSAMFLGPRKYLQARRTKQ